MQYIPYTTCQMVPEEHCQMVTCRRCYMVPEQKVQYIPYTTCHMVREEHCRMVDLPSVLHGAGGEGAVHPVHDLPHGAGAALPMVTCRTLLHGARGEGAVHPVHDLPDGARGALPDGHLPALLHGAGGARCSRSRTPPAGWCRRSTVEVIKCRRCRTVTEERRPPGAVHDLPDGDRGVRAAGAVHDLQRWSRTA